YIYNLRNPQLYYLDADEAKFSKNFARFINYKNVEDLRQLFINARRDIAGNCNAKIVLFDVAVKNIMLIKRGS
ncbi:MAG: DNA polymerase III subunit delta, partial [Muribaculaceae bacterium]|nr:DNA polymerase III subunit delta [Muribaculaceae bacterium]